MHHNHQQNQITTTTNTTTTTKKFFNVKFERRVLDKLLWLRDYKEDEVAVLGQTLPEDPLHVVEIHLVKQEVSTGKADMDADDVGRHVDEMIDKGVMPINSERFWIHTHPMHGAGSANPSSIDMEAWTCKENSQKNFMVMFIISRTGEMTCKVRLKQDSTVKGFEDFTHTYEDEAEILIVDNTGYNDEIKQKLVELVGEKAVSLIPFNALYSAVGFEGAFPEIVADLKAQYEKFVSKKTYQVYNAHGVVHSGRYNGHHTPIRVIHSPRHNQKKIPLKGETIPGLLAVISEHKTDINGLENETKENEEILKRISQYYEEIGYNNFNNLKIAYADFMKNHYEAKTNPVKFFQAVICVPECFNNQYDYGKINIKTLDVAQKIRFLNVAKSTFTLAKEYANTLECCKQTSLYDNDYEFLD